MGIVLHFLHFDGICTYECDISYTLHLTHQRRTLPHPRDIVRANRMKVGGFYRIGIHNESNAIPLIANT